MKKDNCTCQDVCSPNGCCIESCFLERFESLEIPDNIKSNQPLSRNAFSSTFIVPVQNDTTRIWGSLGFILVWDKGNKEVKIKAAGADSSLIRSGLSYDALVQAKETLGECLKVCGKEANTDWGAAVCGIGCIVEALGY